MSGEAFVKPQNEAPGLDAKTFDLDQWLSGTMRVTKYVDVYGKPGLQAEIDELDSQLRRTEDERVRREVAESIEALRAEMEASRVGFKFTSLSDARVDELRDQYKGEDALTSALAILAEHVEQPADPLQGHALRLDALLGEGYFAQTIIATGNSAQQGLGVTVPFSSAASAALRR